ncbi:MAG: hypothetical protein KAJ20_00790 [Candidatus Aenigmarchaeota archaeon]|nr:hypothetical protein [Candidatus Aenigmarchaeota archaeon]
MEEILLKFFLGIVEPFARHGIGGLFLFVVMIVLIVYVRATSGHLKSIKEDNISYHNKRLLGKLREKDPNRHFESRHLVKS